MDKEKLTAHLIDHMPEDESSDLHRFLQDLLILIEFGHFDEEEDY